jgi:hypothetical protein
LLAVVAAVLTMNRHRSLVKSADQRRELAVFLASLANL